MKHTYNQPVSLIETFETKDLLQTVVPSPLDHLIGSGDYGVDQKAPARQYAPSQQYK